MIGQRLGPYEITAKLGEGGMGEVYRATDSRLKRAVRFTCDSTETTELYDDADIETVVVATGERKLVLHGASQARYLDPGILVFARGGTLFATEGSEKDLWDLDLEQRSRTRLTFDGDVTDPTWSPDGKRLAYVRTGVKVGGGSDIFWKPADGSGEAQTLVAGPEVVFAGALSPDGKWIAYLSTDAGRTEVFVRPFPSGPGKWQLSAGGAVEPHWSSDSRSIFFRRGSFVVGAPERVFGGFRPGDNSRSYSPAPDGQRFAALPGWNLQQATAQVDLALHWDREDRRLLKLEP